MNFAEIRGEKNWRWVGGHIPGIDALKRIGNNFLQSIQKPSIT